MKTGARWDYSDNGISKYSERNMSHCYRLCRKWTDPSLEGEPLTTRISSWPFRSLCHSTDQLGHIYYTTDLLLYRWRGMDCIALDLRRYRFWLPVNAVMNFGLHKYREFLDWLRTG